MLVEFTSEAGFGRVRLDDGRLVTFDAACCLTAIPEIGAEVEVEVGEGPRGPLVKKLAAVPTDETRDVYGVLAVWGQSPSALCFSTEGNMLVVVPFEQSAWRGETLPQYGQPVRCRQPVTHAILPPGGWGHTRAVAVEPAAIPAFVATKVRAALASHGHEHTFPGYRRAQRVMPLVRPASGEPTWNQSPDWPMCPCSAARTRTTFLGHPQNGASLDEFVRQGARYYENGVVSSAEACSLVSEKDEPEDWSDVACFSCESCGARYFTFQFT